MDIVRMLQACDGQMFEEDTAVKYQVSVPLKKKKREAFTFYCILSVILEAFEQAGGPNPGGSCQESGANSQGTSPRHGFMGQLVQMF